MNHSSGLHFYLFIYLFFLGVVPAWKPYNSVEGQESCENVVHSVQSTHNTVCGEEAEGWKQGHVVPCPDAVVVYNKFMGGVDKGDQLQHYYRIRTKCVKNYKQIFWFTIAHILSHFSPVTTSERSLKPSASHLPNS